MQLNATDAEGSSLTYAINDSMITINATAYMQDNPSIAESVIQNYSIMVNVTDGTLVTNMTFTYQINNSAPTAPVLDAPADSASQTTEPVGLEWNASTDGDGDTINYYVYGENSTTPTVLLTNTTGTTYNWAGLVSGTTYYWKVVASDGYKNASSATRNIAFAPVGLTATQHNWLKNVNIWVGDMFKDFEIDSIAVISPLYRNENIYLEATFSDSNGTFVTPDAYNITIFDSSNNVFTSSVSGLSDADGDGVFIWNAVSIPSNPTTGTYKLHLWANNSYGRVAAKSVEFRVATGGPYYVGVTCPLTTERGSAMACVVKITDEGEEATESTTTVWVDSNNDSSIGIGEPQSSFSIETIPQQNVSQSVNVNIPSTFPLNTYIVRAETSYATSAQPNSTASTTTTVIEATAGDEGGGGNAATAIERLKEAVAEIVSPLVDVLNRKIFGVKLLYVILILVIILIIRVMKRRRERLKGDKSGA